MASTRSAVGGEFGSVRVARSAASRASGPTPNSTTGRECAPYQVRARVEAHGRERRLLGEERAEEADLGDLGALGAPDRVEAQLLERVLGHLRVGIAEAHAQAPPSSNLQSTPDRSPMAARLGATARKLAIVRKQTVRRKVMAALRFG
jgi:hypothetical protein